MTWFYNGQPFTSEMIGDWVGFVYVITALDTGKKYIGQKRFVSSKKIPATKKRKAKRVKMESDWQDYYGSSEALKTDVAKLGKDRFHREIIRLCISKGDMNYIELREQILAEVLTKPDEYYNVYVGSRIHRSHLKDVK